MFKISGIGLMMILLFSACKDQQNVSFKHDDAYEKSKNVLQKAEQKNPLEFLTISVNTRKNVMGKTVITGNIYNHGKVVTFKDIELKHQFYTQTGALVEEDVEVIYEAVPPGGSRPFKSKYMAPKSTDSVSVTISSAKF